MAAADYPACEDRVLLHEGSKYTDGVHPYDPGGPTRWGITIADARMYWKSNATADDVRNMPRSVAVDIYRKHYWAPIHGDELPAGVDDTVYDYGINSGIGRSGRVLRHVVGLPTDDWHITPAVLEAVSKRDHAAVINAICDERMTFLQHLSIWPTYRTGWTIRVREVRAFSLELNAKGSIGVAPVPTAPPKVTVPPKITPIPSETMGKGKVPEPTTQKQVNVAGGTGLAAALASSAHWLGAHPATSVGIVTTIVIGVIVIHGLIMRRHQQQSEHPMPGTPVVPERA